ncbi:DUF2536 family protein [Alkalicoccus urumqiensis]|uniref:DUF2536 domain-containing protein n=1 Tax=Alkalicoccus urumqiensis TaxID=1548213 RepID=A0A2P6MFI7_ALKUR|nr:DUF2536 family protein [Alkalicoccus urumqiensis]PRO65038.1 DUF2536 domain-containing protein [Alkalicoccus urumqiensis]
MILQPDSIRDKIEFFEANTLAGLEKQIQEKIDDNQALLLEVHHVQYQHVTDRNGRMHVSAVVHFKQRPKNNGRTAE